MTEFEKIISVIVPFYNAESTIKKCLDSLAAQTFDADKTEILLINDGSTDGSADIVRDFAVDSVNASVITQEHRGL
ncbi:MAG: glycosyltransferase family 2 protein, partial [Clostridiaceae bacterium]|nr:glycosyltransferase family 2 protein [Clostridiaceae bacterium]